MIKNPFFNEMILLSAEKKGKRGDGATAILSLMSSTLDFLDKVDVCVEAVTHPSNQQKLQEYKSQVENMYTEMAEMSKGAIKDITNPEEAVEGVEGEVESTIAEEPVDAPVASPATGETEAPITMVNAPVVPKL